MKNRLSLPRTLLLVALTVWLASCASSPEARFYTLSTVSHQETKSTSRHMENPLSVSIAPVEIPDYLDRPQIVTRDGRNELKLAEFDRWGGALRDNIAAVLAENLALLLDSDRVYVYPRTRAEKADYEVAMRVLRLDCAPGDKVLLKAQWVVTTGQEKKEIATHISTFTESLNDSRYDTLVAAISQTLALISREIAQEITGAGKNSQ